MKFRIRLLLTAFAISFILVASLSAISYRRFSQLNKRVGLVEHSYAVSNLINVLDDHVRELDKAYFRYLVTEDDSFRQNYFHHYANLQSTIKDLGDLTSDNKIQQNLLVMFKTDLSLYYAQSMQAKNITDTSMPGRLINNYQKSQYWINSAANTLTKMGAHENMLLKERTEERKTYGELTADMIKTLSAVFGILTLIFFFFLIREFRKRVIAQKALQQKLVELDQSRFELEHIAFATSHDLQEPLRKIQILTDRLRMEKGQQVNVEPYDTLSRVIAAAGKMQDLVSELMILTSLNNNEKEVNCRLNALLAKVVDQYQPVIHSKHVQIQISELPVIKGYPDQIVLLFKNLIDNALKFSREGIHPVISIHANQTNGDDPDLKMQNYHHFHCITIQDNGVGFDNEFSQKIFGIFRQLHSEKDGFSGRGTGLAICQRIMNNHKGKITAHGFPGTGAIFRLYFPIPDHSSNLI